jgi:hypothetical protein
MGRGTEGPDPAGGGEAIVLDAAVGDGQGPSGGSGDGCGSGVGLQRAGIGEWGAVVAEDAGANGVGQTGEAGDDGVVRMGVEQLG